MLNKLDNILVLIPSLDPEESLITLIKDIKKEGLKNILVVDDGSKKEAQYIFNELEKESAIVLHHEINKGKGAALKTGFYYAKKEKFIGVITADADGQHAPDDIRKCAEELAKTNAFVLGTRDFNEEIVPFKSRYGNKITTVIFKILYGNTINDTQTGLRGIPGSFLNNCLSIDGDRFEYEMKMLIEAVKLKLDIKEIYIKTIYYNGNRETHFNTVKDSMNIYISMFSYFIRFSFSSVLCGLIDLGLFNILYNLLTLDLNTKINIFLSTFISRIVSSLTNYWINKNVVFNSKNKTTLIKYFILCLSQLTISSQIVFIIKKGLNLNVAVIKLFVDSVLFFVSYKIQNSIIFK